MVMLTGGGLASLRCLPPSSHRRSRFDFLNKVDHQMARLKVDADFARSAQSTSVTLSKDQSDPDGLLCTNLMSTTVGRELAGGRARDKIQAILVGGRSRDRGVGDDDVQSIRSDTDVRQLRHHLGRFLTPFPALYHPTRAACNMLLLSAHADRGMTGADWCLQSDVLPDACLQASPNSTIDLVLDSYGDEASENDLSRDLDVYDL